jgi:hypothetical protein
MIILGTKWPEHEADYLTSNAEVNNAWSFAPTTEKAYAFETWYFSSGEFCPSHLMLYNFWS